MAVDLKRVSTMEGIELQTEDGSESVYLAVGSLQPEQDYPDAPVGTFFFRSDGLVMRRLADTGSGQAVDWSEGTGGTGTATQNLPFFLSNGSQDNILIINGGLPFFLANGLSDPITIV